MALKIERTPGKVLVREGGKKVGQFNAVNISGCDVHFPARGRMKVHGYQAMWEDENGALQVSDDERNPPSHAPGGGIDLGL